MPSAKKRHVHFLNPLNRALALEETLWALEWVKLISWVVMSNHFHILVEVLPVDREAMPATEVFRRLGLIP